MRWHKDKRQKKSAEGWKCCFEVLVTLWLLTLKLQMLTMGQVYFAKEDHEITCYPADN